MARKTPCRCDICGASSNDRRVVVSRKFNMTLCNKHYVQMKLYGRIINSSPYSRFDRNDYRVENGIVYMDICDAFRNKIGETMFDEKFLNDVIWRKWKICYKRNHQYPYISTQALPEEKIKHMPLHRYIARLGGLDIDHCEIDHINGDTMDNRLCNLRCANRHDQVSNIAPKHTNKYGIRGISFDKKYNKYVIDFGIDHKRYYFKPFKTLPEAVYARYTAERYFFDDVALSRHIQDMQPYIDMLTDAQKADIESYVIDIIRRKERDAS